MKPKNYSAPLFQPSEWTNTQQQEAAAYLSRSNTLSGLRRRQAINRSQISDVYRRLPTSLDEKPKLERGLANLRVMERILALAVDLMCFP